MKRTALFTVSNCLLSIVLALSVFNSPKLSSTVKNFGVCPGLEKVLRVQLKNTHVNNAQIPTLISYDFIVKEDLPANAVNIWTITKCRSREAPDTCVQLSPMKTTKLCSMMNSGDEMWVSMLKCYSPKISCPLKKGVFHARNCTQDPNLFTIFQMSSSYWKFRLEMAHPRTKATLLCINIEIEVTAT